MEEFEVTRAELLLEIEEKSEDLRVFSEARDLIRRRVQELADSPSKLTPLPQWSGTDAVLGSLDLAISAMSGTVRELQMLAERTQEERPRFRVIEGGEGIDE